jgi:hypothetical protein
MTPTRAAGELPPIMDLQRSYIAANGGLANIQELSSLIADGEITDADGNRHSFKLYRKRPDLMRMQVDLPGRMQVTTFDGSNGYKLISREGAPDEVVDLNEEETLALEMSSSMDGPLFQLRSRPERLEVVAEVEVDGESAYEITISDSADSMYDRVWISQEHYQEVKLTRPLDAGEGGVALEEIYFSDFEKVRGMWVAKLIRYERGGEHIQTVRIDRLRANVGIFDSFFSKPKR